MNTPTGHRRPFKIVLALLLIAILVDQYWATDAFPWLSGVAGINPSVVFLDIPLHFPAAIGLIPVVVIFCGLYAIVMVTTQKGITRRECRKRIGAALGGVVILLCCMVSGGLIYFFAHDQLPREVRNGIDSFGLHLDLYSLYPDHEVIHLRGGMVMLACCLIGLPFVIRKINRQVATPFTAGEYRTEEMPVKRPAIKQAPVKEPVTKQAPAKQQVMKQPPAEQPVMRQPVKQQPLAASPIQETVPVSRRCRVEPLPRNALIPCSAAAILAGKDRKAPPRPRIYYQPPAGMYVPRPTLASETV